MSKKFLIAVAACAFLATAGSEAFSQPPGGPPREGGGSPRDGGGPPREGGGGRGGDRGGPEMMMRMMPVIKALDKDGDGIISSSEIENAIVALKTLDKNGDGKLDQEELRPDFAAMGGRGGPGAGPGGPRGPEGGPGGDPTAFLDRMMAQDKNGDGKLSGDEIPERMRPMLERGDANKDGALDKEELAAAMRNMARGEGGRGGFGGDAGRGRGGEGDSEGGVRPRRPEAE